MNVVLCFRHKVIKKVTYEWVDVSGKTHPMHDVFSHFSRPTATQKHRHHNRPRGLVSVAQVLLSVDHHIPVHVLLFPEISPQFL